MSSTVNIWISSISLDEQSKCCRKIPAQLGIANIYLVSTSRIEGLLTAELDITDPNAVVEPEPSELPRIYSKHRKYFTISTRLSKRNSAK